jgi:hypothetical protein
VSPKRPSRMRLPTRRGSESRRERPRAGSSHGSGRRERRVYCETRQAQKFGRADQITGCGNCEATARFRGSKLGGFRIRSAPVVSAILTLLRYTRARITDPNCRCNENVRAREGLRVPETRAPLLRVWAAYGQLRIEEFAHPVRFVHRMKGSRHDHHESLPARRPYQPKRARSPSWDTRWCCQS